MLMKKLKRLRTFTIAIDAYLEIRADVFRYAADQALLQTALDV